MKQIKIIGLSGAAGSGKDTVGLILERRFGFQRKSYSDLIRKEVCEAILRKNPPVDLPDELLRVFMATKPRMVFQKPYPDGLRKLTQWWGAWRREQNPEHFIDALACSTDWSRDTVLTSIRYPNEHDFIKRSGGEEWRVIGRGGLNGSTAEHPTERFDWQADREIDNSGTLAQLAFLVERTYLEARGS